MAAIQPKSITIEGVTYASYSQAEKELGLAKGSISKRLAREKAQAEADLAADDPAPVVADPEESISKEPPEMAPHEPDNQDAGHDDVGALGTEEEEKVLVYDGVEYATRKQMADALDVDYLRLNAYLRKYEDVDEAVEKCLSGETSLSVTYEDTMYRSFKALCDTYKIAPALVRQVAAIHDSDKMDAFADLATLREVGRMNEDITLTSIPFCILAGMPYKNYKDMAEQFDMDQHFLSLTVKSMGLVAGLQHMQAMQTMAFHVDDADERVSMESIAEALADYPYEFIPLRREVVPQYPLLENIDIYMECYDVDSVRDTIGTGEYAREYQDEPEQNIEQTM